MKDKKKERKCKENISESERDLMTEQNHDRINFI